MFSQGLAGGAGGIAVQGQASPMDMPSTWVRVVGQMGDKPSIKTVHKVGKGTIGTDDACVA